MGSVLISTYSRSAQPKLLTDASVQRKRDNLLIGTTLVKYQGHFADRRVCYENNPHFADK
jgi:hypothetical protein